VLGVSGGVLGKNKCGGVVVGRGERAKCWGLLWCLAVACEVFVC